MIESDFIMLKLKPGVKNLLIRKSDIREVHQINETYHDRDHSCIVTSRNESYFVFENYNEIIQKIEGV